MTVPMRMISQNADPAENRPQHLPADTHLVFLLLPDFSQIALAGAIEPLRVANLVSGQPLYSWSLAAERCEPVRASNGIRTIVDHDLERSPRNERMFILSGLDVQLHVTADLVARLRRVHAHGTRLGALCSGAYVLAAAGLADGHRTAIHWAFHDSFREHFPGVHLHRGVFVGDGPLLSAAGGTATTDLMLHLIGQRHGAELARKVSDQLLHSTARGESAEQRSFPAAAGVKHPVRSAHLGRALRLMERSIDRRLSIAQVARELNISRRHLERLFAVHLKSSPQTHFHNMRLDRASTLLRETDGRVGDIAAACGFSSPSHFAQAFKCRFGAPPACYRASAIGRRDTCTPPREGNAGAAAGVSAA